MKTTKRSMLVSGLCLLLTAVMLLGSTFAWFTDSVTNEGSLWLKYAMHFANVKTTGKADITEVLDVYKVSANANSLEGAAYQQGNRRLRQS